MIIYLASRPGAAPGKLSFTVLLYRLVRGLSELVRLPGIAPGLPAWRADILLLNHNRGN